MKIFQGLMKLYEIKEQDLAVSERLKVLEEKYEALLHDVVRLEEENVETSNCLYELMNSLNAVDARIDILTAEKWVEKNV